jgi:hypothetical protein
VKRPLSFKETGSEQATYGASLGERTRQSTISKASAKAAYEAERKEGIVDKIEIYDSPSDKDDSELSGEGDEKELHVVERILGERMINAQLHFEIKWEGYDTSENTYETEDRLFMAADALATYRSQRAQSRADEQQDDYVEEQQAPRAAPGEQANSLERYFNATPRSCGAGSTSQTSAKASLTATTPLAGPPTVSEVTPKPTTAAGAKKPPVRAPAAKRTTEGSAGRPGTDKQGKRTDTNTPDGEAAGEADNDGYTTPTEEPVGRPKARTRNRDQRGSPERPAFVAAEKASSPTKKKAKQGAGTTATKPVSSSSQGKHEGRKKYSGSSANAKRARDRSLSPTGSRAQERKLTDEESSSGSSSSAEEADSSSELSDNGTGAGGQPSKGT